MTAICLMLVLAGFAVAFPATLVARALGRRLNAMDAPGVKGQIKEAPRRVPNTGGIGIFAGVAVPLLAGLLGARLMAEQTASSLSPELTRYLPGIASESGRALGLLLCLLVLHITGLIDDRRPLGPWSKLVIMLGAAGVCVWWTDSRLLTLLDGHVGGTWASIVVTVVWVGVITNAFNFLDNMDGLSGGVAAVCAGFFLAAALLSQQWFVAATLAVLLGSLLGFLCFNFPFRPRVSDGHGGSAGGASIFMGDGGSLVVGFLIAILSVRITYYPSAADLPLTGASTPWFSVFMPILILAIPLYDFCSVCVLRIRQGKSPFVGDLQHFSHRLVQHGLSRRAAVVVIYGCTAVTGIGAIMLPKLDGWQAALVGVQTLLVLLVIALYEWARTPGRGA